MRRNVIFVLFFCSNFVLFSGWSCPQHAVGQDDSAQAVELHRTASNLYRSGDFELAAEQWESLLKDHADFSLQDEAQLFLGMSYYKSQNYPKAADRFEKLKNSIASIEDFKNGDNLLFFLAYCQHAMGLADDSEESHAKLSQAADNFKAFFDNFPDSSLADQAWYFLGETQYRLGALDKAAQSYQNLVDNFADSDFHGEALYALGVCLEEQGSYSDATGVYEQLIATGEQSPRTLEIRFRLADCKMQMAIASENAGNAPDAAENFTEAEAEFGALADADGFETDEALYHQAFCRLHLKQFKPAADLYAKIANDFPGSRYAARSSLAAGKYYFSAQEMDLAKRWLAKVVEANNEQTYEASHWLSRIEFENQNYEAAFQVADNALKSGGNHPFRVNLLMDAADALYEIPDKKQLSIPIYMQVVTDYGSDRLAPTALYYAAFACLETDDHGEAIKLAEIFKRDYPQHSYLPDTLQVQGEAALKQQQYETAQQVFEELTSRYEGHESTNYWHTRVGWARYLQKNYDDVIAWLAPVLTDIQDETNRSEALFLIGSSQFQLKNYAKAIDALNDCLDAKADRANAHEVRLLTARCHFNLGDSGKALDVAQQGLGQLPAEMEDQTYYWLGEFAYNSSKFDLAAEHYSKVIDSGRDSSFLPNCLYGKSWALLKGNQVAEAIDSFSALISNYPEHELVDDALIGRGMTYRLASQFDEAIADLDRFLESDPPADRQFNALYEKGLAHVGLKEWDKAIDTLLPLAQSDVELEETDNILYELAWAYKTNGDDSSANQYFERLTNDFESSPFAAEAHFHVGQELYDDEKYAEAAGHYRKCLDSSQDDAISEKAAFKLGWSYFQLEDYEKALTAFKDQTNRFPEDSLSADGLFMVSESLHRMDNHEDAVTAYKVAIDAVNASETVRPEIKMLAPIHAAQSANEARDYQQALTFAQSLLDREPNTPFAAEAWYEVGVAQKGLGESALAIEAWEKAMVALNKTGARARCMIGEEHFEKKDYENAIKQFKLVINGYGGLQSADDVRPWQAFAAYEAARCNYVQIRDEQDQQKRATLISEAKKMFQYVVDNFPRNSLAADAQKQLDNLNRIR